MKLDWKLLPPLFQQIKIIQETLNLYCIAADAIPLPKDNLQYAVEQTYGVSIGSIMVPLKSNRLRGAIELYQERATIYMDDNLNPAWQRYVFAKELGHIILGNQDFHTDDPISVIEGVIVDESGLGGDNIPPADVQSEVLTKLAAIELLFPFEFRQKCCDDIKDEKESIFAISRYFGIPEHLVEFALTDMYMEASSRAWAVVNS